MTTEPIDIPIGLRTALESGQCALFVGAGLGCHTSDPDGNHAPNGFELAQEIAAHFKIDVGDEIDLAKLAQVAELRRGRKELEIFVSSKLTNVEPDEIYKWICSVRWKAIFTTNYDSVIERAYELSSNPPQSPIPISSTSGIADYDPRFEVPVYHLHGYIKSDSFPKFLITEDDYTRFREKRRMLFEQLKTHLAVSNILYVGYSNRDPNWRLVLDEVAAEFSPSPMPISYRVSPATDPLDIEILESKRLYTINGDFGKFVETASVVLSTLEPTSDRLKRIESTIPPDFSSAFSDNPAPVVRLLDSWIYVNYAPFEDEPNTYQFLRGEKPNWALVGANHHFERDIEDQIYDDLLDYATSSSQRPRSSLLLAPAGFGVTTVLMSLAARFVTDDAGAVFMLKPGHSLREGDIEFVCTTLSSRVVFIIDDASQFYNQLHQVINRIRELRKPAMFIFGSRLNEWQLIGRPPRTNPYLLEPLSDPEIYRLIDCLQAHGELNELEHLSRVQQHAVIKQKHEKQLLVAMREATEGKDFDAIIEDEYRRLPTEISKQAYLITSCFHQFGVFIRAELLAKLLEVDIVNMYDELNKSTEGIILFELVDESKDIHAAFTRHRTISEIVWERCVSVYNRENIAHKALEALNLGYKSDRDAFENFYRSDQLIDDLGSIESRIRFFDRAGNKDPQNPYIKQHYARMLLRSEHIEMALRLIDNAIDINGEVRIFYHTKGTILKSLAIEADSDDIGRRYMARAEDAFRETIRRSPRDEYGYHGLANLYIEWAKRISDEEEGSEYITKAESIIEEGLSKVRQRERLWVLSANIEEFVGSLISYIDALQKAMNANPEGVIPRYLLGRAYLSQSRPQDTLQVLEPIIKREFQEYRSYLLYSQALIMTGAPYREAIAILRLATPYGFRDARFIATLAGMYFMDGEFSSADDIFKKRNNHNFTVQELERPHFIPRDPETPSEYLRMDGVVMTVKPGYSFIQTDGYPDLFCPASRYEGLILKEGIKISFQPAFTAKGAVAMRPREISE